MNDELSNTNVINEIDSYKIIVLLFDKGHYKRKELDVMSDVEKYKTALLDGRRCKIYDVKEYEDMINSFRPMEKYVWTYIITFPTKIYEHFWE